MVYRRRRFSRKRIRYGYRPQIIKRSDNLGITRSYVFSNRYVPLGSVGVFKLRGTANITTDGSGRILNAFRLTEPQIFDGANPLQDWTFVNNMYDYFRVNRIKLKWIPDLPNDSSTTTAYRPLFVFADTNSATLVPTNNVAIAYDNLKTVDVSKPWKYYLRLPKYQGTGVGPQTYYPMASPPTTGAIYLCQQNSSSLTASTTYGTIVATYYISTKNRM